MRGGTMLAAWLAMSILAACEGPAGPEGPPGADGVDGEDGVTGMDGMPGLAGEACWDASGDGICQTADEDLNDDGNCDYLDCQGEPGADGAQGPQGPQGLEGPPGPPGPPGPAGPNWTVSAGLSLVNDDLSVAANGIVASMIADNAVGASEIATGAVGTSEIADGSIAAADIATSAVTATAIAANAVGASEIAAGAVGTSEIADNSVTSVDIQDGTVQSLVDVSYAGGTLILSTCGEFVAAQTCPAGNQSVGLVDCIVAGDGAFCEYDSGCTGLDPNLDNCPGLADVYIRLD